MRYRFTLGFLLFGFALQPATAESLSPQLVQLDKLVLDANFAKSTPLEKENWKPRQHTRWSIEKGVLRGQPSTKAFQASQDHHQGLEPRLSIPYCPQEYAIQFSIRFLKGDQTPLCPFIEFGHHKARIYWSEQGAQLLANGEAVQLDHNANFKLDPGTWYHALAEIKGDEVLIRFSHGPTLYGKHPSLDSKKDGFGVAGFRGGRVELDDIKIWSIKDSINLNWASHLRQIEPTPHKTLKPEKAKS
ncbi:hypothetical protein F7C95_15180 [Opitutia bacterium ISCC 51]|nr:hypothetical protein F7C95_15180 [Opitutae bacterium ISCC 51]QXD27329.1 hypothetical protein GA003_15085 [Opitutae bacterium ISCC 52]